MPRKTKDQLEIDRLKHVVQQQNHRINELLHANNRFEEMAQRYKAENEKIGKRLDEQRQRADDLPNKIRELLDGEGYPRRPQQMFWAPDAFRPPRW